MIQCWHLTVLWRKWIWRNIWKESPNTLREDSDITRSACWKQSYSDLWRMGISHYGNWKTVVRWTSVSCTLWIMKPRLIELSATLSTKCSEIPSKRYLMISTRRSLKQNMWICSICISTVPSLRQMQTNIPGYGKRQPRNPDTACLIRSRNFCRKSTKRSPIPEQGSVSIRSMHRNT